jgi:hypothetical protein
MIQIIKQPSQRARSIACNDDVWMKCIDIAQELKVSVSAYIRGLMENDIKKRQERLRMGHAAEVIKLHVDRNAEVS